MSLINDALKKANQTWKRQPRSDGAGAFQPAVGSSRPNGAGVLVIVVVLLLVGGLAYGGWRWYSGRKTAAQADAVKAKTKAKPGATNALPAAAAPGTNKNPVARSRETLEKVLAANREGEGMAKVINAAKAAAVAPDAGAPQLPAAESAKPAEVSTNAAPAAAQPGDAFSSFKLQGIMFKPSDPVALINKKKVRIGDDVEGAQVVAIDRQSVTLKKGGQTKDFQLK